MGNKSEEKVSFMFRGEVVAELKPAEKLESYLGKTEKP
ncbi:hypothetical protein [Bacillus phage BM-P1]|nr:hypothetical protein [Bacillus phage BM-P1]